MRQVSYGRIRLGSEEKNVSFLNEGQETGLICVSGSSVLLVGDELFSLRRDGALMFPRGCRLQWRRRPRWTLWSERRRSRASILCSLSPVRACGRMTSCTLWPGTRARIGKSISCWGAMCIQADCLLESRGRCRGTGRVGLRMNTRRGAVAGGVPPERRDSGSDAELCLDHGGSSRGVRSKVWCGTRRSTPCMKFLAAASRNLRWLRTLQAVYFSVFSLFTRLSMGFAKLVRKAPPKIRKTKASGIHRFARFLVCANSLYFYRLSVLIY